MELIKLKCNNCGYEKECLATELEIAECPICNTKGSLKVVEEDREALLESNITEHIRFGFRQMGIEKTLELIDKDMAGQQRDYYLHIVKKNFRGLDKCFTIQS